MKVDSSAFFVNLRVERRDDLHRAERVRPLGLLLRRQRRRQRIDALGDDHRAGVQLAVPEVRHLDGLLEQRHLRRRRVLRRLFGRRLLDDDVDVVGAGRHRERSADPLGALGVAGTLNVLCPRRRSRRAPRAAAGSCRPSGSRAGGVAGAAAAAWLDDAPVHGQSLPGGVGWIDHDGERHVLLVALRLQHVLACPGQRQIVRRRLPAARPSTTCVIAVSSAFCAS